MEGSEKSKSSKRGARTRNSSQSEEEAGDEDHGKPFTQLSELHVGMKLEAMDKYGKWYIAKVLELDESSVEVLVHFERWSSRYDEYIPLKSGHLRQLSLTKLEELKRDQEKAKKQFKPGDRIQAKWIDGRMYFGKVIKVHDADVDLLFDDDVEYTAPIVSVRKRIPDRQIRGHVEDTSRVMSLVEGRRCRAMKRKRAEDSSSQTTPSPSNSPLYTPPKKMRPCYFDSDSTGTESDIDDSNKLRYDSHVPKIDNQTKVVKMKSAELPNTSQDLQKLKALSKLSPVKEVLEVAEGQKQFSPHSTSMEIGFTSEKSSEFVHSSVKAPNKTILETIPVVAPSASDISSNQKSVSSSRPKRAMAHSQSGSTSSKDTVATRTRAHTRFESVVKPKLERKGGKTSGSKFAPKELVIAWDHNEFKCKVSGCNKSFRKDSLLQSHLKHYHSPPPPKVKPAAKGKGSGGKSKALSPQPSSHHHQSPCSAKSTPESKTSSSQSPESIKLKDSPSAVPKLDNKATPPQVPTQHDAQRSLEIKKEEKEVSEVAKVPTSNEADESQNTSVLSTKPRKQQRGDVNRKQNDQLSSVGEGGGFLSVAAVPTAQIPMADVKVPSHDLLVQSPKQQASQPANVKPDCLEMGSKVTRHHSASRSSSSESSDDVVHCTCGSDVDEGFMIQCEQCLCWQHGDCIGIRSDFLPKKYICCICCNPPGQRSRMKYKYSQDWYGEGILPSIPGSPSFPASQSRAVLVSHEIASSLYKVKKMIHSSEVKLQAASNPHHPYLKQWAKECSHYDRDTVLSYLMSHLLPVSYQPTNVPNLEDSSKQKNSSEQEGEEKVHDSNQILRASSLDGTENQDGTKSGDETGNHDGTKSGDETGNHDGTKSGDGSENQDGSSKTSDTETKVKDNTPKRELRNSTVIQKNAVYCTPKRSKSKLSPSTNVVTASCGESARVQLDPLVPNNTDTSMADSSGEKNVNLKLAPLPPLSKEDLNALTTVTSQVLKTSLHQTGHSSGASDSERPIPSLQSQDCLDMAITSGNATKTDRTLSEEPGVIIVSDDEFGVSEIPVFAMEADTPSKPNLPQSGLTISVNTSYSSPSPKSFSPSAKSAFKPVSSKSNLISVGKSTSFPSISSLNFESMPKSTTTSALRELSSKLGIEAVTLGEFSEAFMRGDTTNWFKRMKLLDHIEVVQDNVQAWLEMIEKKLEEVPDDADRLEDCEKFITEVHSTVNKLKEYQRNV